MFKNEELEDKNDPINVGNLSYLIGMMQALLYTAHSHFNSQELKLYQEINDTINHYYRDPKDGT